jgi:dTDP-4-dehydrorhamnose 3,5-epimerase
MDFLETELPGVLLLEPKLFKDERGFFLETFKAQDFSRAGIPVDFVQDNQSGSHRGVLRGLHYQIQQAQGKLVRVTAGEVYDVVVDLRRKSPAFGKSAGFKISSDDKRQLWIPAGFAHGFLVLSEWAEINYKATAYYAPQFERTLLWNDPALGIPWPLANGQSPIVSAKDAQGSPLATAEVFNDVG